MTKGLAICTAQDKNRCLEKHIVFLKQPSLHCQTMFKRKELQSQPSPVPKKNLKQNKQIIFVCFIFWKNKFDQIWSNLIKFDQIWSNLIKSEFWSNLIRFDQIWSDLIRFRISCLFFRFFVPKKQRLWVFSFCPKNMSKNEK